MFKENNCIDEEENHKYNLIKMLILCYGKIQFHNIVKQTNQKNCSKIRN